MIWMYLKNTYTGAMSKVKYYAGERVHVLSRNNEMCLVQHESGVKFHVQFDLLSDVPVPKEYPTEIEKPKPKSLKQLKPKRR